MNPSPLRTLGIRGGRAQDCAFPVLTGINAELQVTDVDHGHRRICGGVEGFWAPATAKELNEVTKGGCMENRTVPLFW